VQRGGTYKVNADGTAAAGGGLYGNTLVFYQYKGGYAGDVLRYNLTSHHRSKFPPKVDTRYDEYHPTISGHWLLFTRYIDTTNTEKVFLYNTRSGSLRMLGSATGAHRDVYSGQVNGDYATWGRVRPNGQDVYLYRISTKETTTIPRHVFAQYDPSVASDGTVYYERSGDECGAYVKLVRYPPGGPATVLYSFPIGIDGGYTYVDEPSNGTLDFFYAQYSCRNDSHWDIYKLIDSYTVDVSKGGDGSGAVTSSPTGISCGTECEAVFHGGTKVTFTATADPGSVFKGWSDPTCGSSVTCTMTIETQVSLTATFVTST
jgi:hypothetical protein